jgi:BolA protein
MNRAERIDRLLTDALAPHHLDIVDESHRHAGHAGARAGGETHYRVTVVADAFEGESRVARQRRINALLAGEFADGLHALSIRALTPAEFAKTGDP